MSHTEKRVQQDAVGVEVLARFVRADGSAIVLDGFTIAFRFQKPSGVLVELAGAQVDPGGNVAHAFTPAGFFDELGPWRGQARASGSGKVWPAEVEGFAVAASIPPPPAP